MLEHPSCSARAVYGFYSEIFIALFLLLLISSFLLQFNSAPSHQNKEVGLQFSKLPEICFHPLGFFPTKGQIIESSLHAHHEILDLVAEFPMKHVYCQNAMEMQQCVTLDTRSILFYFSSEASATKVVMYRGTIYKYQKGDFKTL